MNKKKKVFSLLFAAALCLCLCAALFGCADSENENQSEAADMIELSNWQFTSGVPNNAITVHSENESYVFSCTVDNGQFWSYNDQKFVKSVELNPEETTWWIDSSAADVDFIAVTIEESDSICGYAVIAVNKTQTTYTAEIIKSALFNEAKTTEQVKELINEAKNNYNK